MKTSPAEKGIQRGEERTKKGAAEEALGTFCHEVNNLLGSVVGYAELARDPESPEDQRTYLNHVLGAAYKIQGMVANVLASTRLRNNPNNLNLKKSNIRDLIKKAIEQLTFQIQEKSIKIIITEDSASPETHLDPEKIEMVIRNLLENAIKFSPFKGNIYINTKQNENFMEINIRDEGCGIPEGETEKIFERFFQSSHTINLKKGTGIGLNICQKIINLHNGEIFATNNPQRGSTFTIKIPILNQSA